MHDDSQLVEARLERVLRERIRPAIYPQTLPLSVQAWHVDGEPAPVSEALAAQYAPAAVGDRWGPPWGTSWFRVTGQVPQEWQGQEVEAVVDLGFPDEVPKPARTTEGLVFGADGKAVKGLHSRSQWIPVTAEAVGDESVEFFVEGASNPRIFPPLTNLGDLSTAGSDLLYRLERADLAVIDRNVWNLALDLDVLGELMHELPTESTRRWELTRAIGKALDALDVQNIPETAASARKELAPALSAPAHASAHRVSAIGHAHIDTAWKWPTRETVRKVARTVSHITTLMDDHPGFVYVMSQAQQYAWLKESHPDVYERMQKKVRSGQFVPVGGMWVEADTNMPGGEAMARQFVYGQRFFADEFGKEAEEVWLPDSFGYSAAMPQIVKLAGFRWFLTQKLSWSQTNQFPHHTFRWEGIDGTQVFTHFPPVDRYNAELTGSEMAHLVRNFREKGSATRSVVPFGYGDGGGGPTREMLARAARLRDLEGSPRVEIEGPEAFFAKAEAEYADAPVWVGELYLELHQGTFTTQTKIKQGNRRSEHLLREAELWAATAAVRCGFDYPYEQLERLWKTVLLNQFHDILPGSSIAWVNREARAAYETAISELTGIVSAAQRELAGSGDRSVAFNAAPHSRGGVVPGGAAVRGLTDDQPATAAETEDGWVLNNALIRVTIDRRGLVTSVVDSFSERECVPPDQAVNLLQLHPDFPRDWDAWDIDVFYRNNVTDLTEVDEITEVASRPGTATVRVQRRFGASTVTQDISLEAGACRVDFATEVDWHETEKILKASMPIDVRADTSAGEIQFGHLQRPTHTNTSWEAEKFEICAHRYMYVGEPGWGAAIVNDSTYGHDVTRAVRDDGGTTTTVRLSLLRAPRFPDPETDQGTHRFGYALVPNATELDAAREGHWINLPERTVLGSQGVEPLISVDNEKVIVSAVKLADDGSNDVVVRVYEAVGGRAHATLTSNFDVVAADEADLLERPLGTVRTGSRIELDLRPFQVLTLRLRRGEGSP